MILFNTGGEKVFAVTLKQGENRFAQLHLSSGLYYAHILIDGKLVSKKIIVSKKE